MSLTQREVVRPDAVLGMDADAEQQRADAEQQRIMAALSPCPVCGASPEESPEGMDRHTGEATWQNPHCWRCGFRPAADPTVEVEKQKMFAAFQDWYARQTAADMAHPTLQPPTASTEAELRAQVEALQNQLAERQGVTVDPTSSQPMTEPSAVAEPVTPSVVEPPKEGGKA